MSTVLILPSPLLPASAYRELATALTDRGADARVAPATLGPGEGAHDLVQRWSRLTAPDAILVPHSNAGYLAPLVRAIGSPRSRVVFMDAALPPASGPQAAGAAWSAPSPHQGLRVVFAGAPRRVRTWILGRVISGVTRGHGRVVPS